MTTRKDIADYIHARLQAEKGLLAEEFAASGTIKTCCLDQVLPDQLARTIYDCIPGVNDLKGVRINTFREKRYEAVLLKGDNRLLMEAVFAFHDPRVVAVVEEITGLRDIEPDKNVYTGGLSVMQKGDLLYPHLDNSHNHARERYRVLLLTYYVTPGRKQEHGGNLNLWDGGIRGQPRVIVSRFNRLILMRTDRQSWHSVDTVRSDLRRCCIFNYYYSKHGLGRADYFHVTSYRGLPDHPIRDVVLRSDTYLRSAIRQVFKKGIGKKKPKVRGTD